METKVFNNATDLKSMLQCLLYCDDPVKYISGQHPEWSVLFDENANSIVARQKFFPAGNRSTKQPAAILCRLLNRLLPIHRLRTLRL